MSYTDPLFKEVFDKEGKTIVERIEDVHVPNLTKREHIEELKRNLVQTCIDYIKKHGLADIYSVHFSANELYHSAEYGEWHPAILQNIVHINRYLWDGLFV